MSVWTRLTTEERGISAVLISICLVAIFGAAMLSVDAGQLWGARRNMVTATDASALAQARYYATFATTQPTACNNVYSDTLDLNANETFDVTCQIINSSSDGSSGVVIVQARKTSKGRFSGVLGIGDSSAFSMSAAQWGFTQPLGLRPIALCINDPHIQDALLLGGTSIETHGPLNLLSPDDYYAPDAATPAPDGTPDYAHHPDTVINGTQVGLNNFNATPAAQRGVVHHIDFESSCNGAPGNFGWVDLDQFQSGGNSFPDGDIADWLLNGYYGNQVLLNPDPTATDCDTSTTTLEDCNGDTGAHNSDPVRDALDFLMDPDGDGVKNPLSVPIILYNGGSGTGSNANFNMVAIVNVRIWDYNLPLGGRFLDLEFMNQQTDGVCCSSTGNTAPGLPSAKGTRLCGQDHDYQDPTLVAARCTFS